MKIDASLPVQYEQGPLPATGEGYEKRSVDVGKGRDAGNVLVPVQPQLPDDIVDINGWSAKKTAGGLTAERSAAENAPQLRNRPAEEGLQSRSASENTKAVAVYVLQQYRNQAASAAANAGDVTYPKGSMIDVWA